MNYQFWLSLGTDLHVPCVYESVCGHTHSYVAMLACSSNRCNHAVGYFPGTASERLCKWVCVPVHSRHHYYLAFPNAHTPILTLNWTHRSVCNWRCAYFSLGCNHCRYSPCSCTTTIITSRMKMKLYVWNLHLNGFRNSFWLFLTVFLFCRKRLRLALFHIQIRLGCFY